MSISVSRDIVVTYGGVRSFSIAMVSTGVLKPHYFFMVSKSGINFLLYILCTQRHIGAVGLRNKENCSSGCHKHQSVKDKGNVLLAQHAGALEEVKKFVTTVPSDSTETL